MKLRFIPGLIALQMAAAFGANAQNYFIKIGGDKSTRVADHASWEKGPINFNETLESYNLGLPGGDNAVGMMRFYSPTGSLGFASHYRLNNSPEQVIARRILSPAFNNSLHVVGEKLGSSGDIKSVAVLTYDLGTGAIIASYELPDLPNGYSFQRVHDVISEPDFQNRMRILCTVTKGDDQSIMELLYNANNNTYKIRQYKPVNLVPERYRSVYYVRAYHYSEFNLGDISFYGMADYKDNSVAFCYDNGKYEQYHLSSVGGKEGIEGVQMNGSYGANGNHRRIDMAFTDLEGALCMQQKDELSTLNWRRFYNLPEGCTFELGWGRNGHGNKQGGGMDYFLAAAHFPGDANKDGHIASLHYNALNGDLNKPNIYNQSGIGVHKDGGFPNTTYDPGTNYTFIADRFNQENGFKFATSNASNDEIKCTKPVPVKEFRNKLKELQDDINVETYETYNAHELEMVEVADISVDIVKECDEEQRGGKQGGKEMLTGSSELQMNATGIRVTATGKMITSLRLISIDGRLVAETQHINSSSYKQQFSATLVPGIYVVSIVYDDQSTENRKVSIQ